LVVGVPKEIKDHETRVGCVPSTVTALRENGHEVLVETRAGMGSSITDEEYAVAGAIILDSASEVWSKSDLVVNSSLELLSWRGHRPGTDCNGSA
jgi:alanine dehydrogenase